MSVSGGGVSVRGADARAWRGVFARCVRGLTAGSLKYLIFCGEQDIIAGR